MTLGYRLTEAADADIDEIYAWTLETWGEAKADEYFHGLYDAFDRIIDNPYLGTDRPEFGENIQFIRFKSHRIFYRPRSDIIEILAVVHVRRMVTSDIIFRGTTPEE